MSEKNKEHVSKHNRAQREAYVASVVDLLDKSSSVVIIDYRGINVEQDTAMRKALREAGVTYRVIKNSALSRAFSQKGLEGYDDKFVGPTAAAFGGDDPISPCRVLVEYAGKTPIQIKTACVEGSKYDEEGVKALAKIPDKNTLVAQLLGLLTSPMRSLAVALSEVAKQKA